MEEVVLASFQNSRSPLRPHNRSARASQGASLADSLLGFLPGTLLDGANAAAGRPPSPSWPWGSARGRPVAGAGFLRPTAARPLPFAVRARRSGTGFAFACSRRPERLLGRVHGVVRLGARPNRSSLLRPDGVLSRGPALGDGRPGSVTTGETAHPAKMVGGHRHLDIGPLRQRANDGPRRDGASPAVVIDRTVESDERGCLPGRSRGRAG